MMRRSAVLGLVLLFAAGHLEAQESLDRSRDRGPGQPLSMFGTYISKGELVVYPFFEYYRDHDYEYEAGELGFEGTTELRGLSCQRGAPLSRIWRVRTSRGRRGGSAIPMGPRGTWTARRARALGPTSTNVTP